MNCTPMMTSSTASKSNGRSPMRMALKPASPPVMPAHTFSAVR